MTKITSRLRGDYLAALQREKMLREAMEKQKQEANKLNESAIEYSLLKRDLETNRTLYEGLLEKLKEAGVTAGLRSNNIRPVDLARVPTAPTEPNFLEISRSRWPWGLPPALAWLSCWKASTTPCVPPSRRKQFPRCHRWA